MMDALKTRKVLMGEELAVEMFTRDYAGRRLVLDWGSPDDDGFWTPTITVIDDGYVLVRRDLAPA